MLDETGLDPDFLDESSKINIEDYICWICQNIPNPHTCIEEENCGHFFCQVCINQWLKKSNCCPFCHQIITKRNVKDKNKVIFRHLINLIVLCQEENCNWKGAWKEYYDHSKNSHNKIINGQQENNNFELYKYYKSTTHEHPLKFLDTTMDNGWGCDGRKLPNKCFSGITDFKQTKGIPRFRCEKCDFDLCENCFNHYNIKLQYELNKSYKTNIHSHPLTFLDKTRDNGWACDGRKLKLKCFSGLKDFSQTKGIPRFRCDKCDFDLCKNCMDYYYASQGECIIF